MTAGTLFPADEDIRVSWREFETDLKDDGLRNEFRRSGFALRAGYAF